MIYLLFDEKVSTIINDSLATVEPVDYFSIMHYYWRLGIVEKKTIASRMVKKLIIEPHFK